MSDPSALPQGFYTLQLVSAGGSWLTPSIAALSAILGGYIAVVARLRLEKKQEIDYIKVSLDDEISEIISVIDKMLETHNTTNIIPATYFNELDENRESFNQHKPRIFLIHDAALRKAICVFYKKLVAEVKKARDVVGTLDAPNAATGSVTAAFGTIRSDATTLQTSIRRYKLSLF